MSLDIKISVLSMIKSWILILLYGIFLKRCLSIESIQRTDRWTHHAWFSHPGGKPASEAGQYGRPLWDLAWWEERASSPVTVASGCQRTSPKTRPGQSQSSSLIWVVHTRGPGGHVGSQHVEPRNQCQGRCSKEDGSKWAVGKMTWAIWRAECCPWLGFWVFLGACCESSITIHIGWTKVQVEVLGSHPRLPERHSCLCVLKLLPRAIVSWVRVGIPYRVRPTLQPPGTSFRNWGLMEISLRILLWATETNSG